MLFGFRETLAICAVSTVAIAKAAKLGQVFLVMAFKVLSHSKISSTRGDALISVCTFQ